MCCSIQRHPAPPSQSLLGSLKPGSTHCKKAYTKASGIRVNVFPNLVKNSAMEVNGAKSFHVLEGIMGWG